MADDDNEDNAKFGDTVACIGGKYIGESGLVYRVTKDFVFYKTSSGKRCQSAHHKVEVVSRGPQYQPLPYRPRATTTTTTTDTQANVATTNSTQRIDVLCDLLIEQLSLSTPEERERVLARFRDRFTRREEAE